MNCKPGDIAIVVRSAKPENIGALVRVLRRFFAPVSVGCAYEAFGAKWLANEESPMWVVEAIGRPLVCSHSQQTLRIRPWADYGLRPIRDPGDDAVDEMLRIAGRPDEIIVVTSEGAAA